MITAAYYLCFPYTVVKLSDETHKEKLNNVCMKSLPTEKLPFPTLISLVINKSQRAIQIYYGYFSKVIICLCSERVYYRD